MIKTTPFEMVFIIRATVATAVGGTAFQMFAVGALAFNVFSIVSTFWSSAEVELIEFEIKDLPY